MSDKHVTSNWKILKMNVIFDKKVSKALKGILIIIMYWSHMFNHPERLQKEIEWISLFKIGGRTVEEFLVPFFHVAVPCFFFIAGYGYYISNLNRTKSAKKQILGLYTKYWIVFAAFIPLCAILGKIQITPVSLLLNLIGLSSSYCGEWWFLSTYVEIIFVFSLIDKYIRNHNVKTIHVFTVSVALSFAGYLINAVLSHVGIDTDNLILHELYYFLIKQPLFIIGWCLARCDYIKKMNAFLNRVESKKKVLLICILCIFTFTFQYITLIPETYIYIVYLPVFVYMFSLASLMMPKLISQIFEEFGKYSTYMWLCHSILLYKLVQKYIYFPKISILCWMNLVCLSFGCSIILANIEKSIWGVFRYFKES